MTRSKPPSPQGEAKGERPFQGSTGPLPDAPSPRRAAILAETRSWLGTPYVHQASAKGQGADCLGLVRGVWRGVMGSEPEMPPPYTPDWNERAHLREGAEPLLEAARRRLVETAPAARRPGDVLVFRVLPAGPAKHCGVLTGEDSFIHAYAGRSVLEGWLSRWWIERLAGVFQFPGAD